MRTALMTVAIAALKKQIVTIAMGKIVAVMRSDRIIVPVNIKSIG